MILLVLSAENQSDNNREFQQKVFRLLCQLGLEDVFGLRRLPLLFIDDHDPDLLSLEVTEGKVNMMMARGSVPDTEVIEALWIFGPQENEACHWRENCFRVKVARIMRKTTAVPR